MRRLPLVLLLAAGCATPEVVEPPTPPRLEGDRPAIGRRLDLEVEGAGTQVRLRGLTGRVTAVCVLGTDVGAAAPVEQRTEGPPQPPPAPGAGGADSLPPPAGGEPPPPALDQGGLLQPDPLPETGGPRGQDLVPNPPPPMPAGQEAPAVAAPPAGETLPPNPPDGSLPAEAEEVVDACERLSRRLADRIAVVGLATSRAIDPELVPFRVYLDPEGDALRTSLDLPPRSQVILVDPQGRVAGVYEEAELDRIDTAAARLVR